MYKSIFENKKTKMQESMVFSVSTIDDAFETIQKCISIIIQKKKSNMAFVVSRIAESVLSGINDAISAIAGDDENKVQSIKKNFMARFIRNIKQNSGDMM